MKYKKETIIAAAGEIRAVEQRICKTFKHGMSDEMIKTNNRQLDALHLARVAVGRMTPKAVSGIKCPECRRSFEKIYEAAEIIYCCPYCGQALEFDLEVMEE